MIAIALQSGSNGNCIYVETNGVSLLFDAGISGVQAEERLAAYGRDIRRVNALIISHDHADHVRCAGVYKRKYGLPVYMTRKTHKAARERCALGAMDNVQNFEAGEQISFGRVRIETVPTPHDAADGVGFVVEAGTKRLGILTDLGHVFDGLADVIHSLNAMFIESNYDVDALASGPYPPLLKQRIRGPGGHISNEEAAELIRASASRRLRWSCLSHLSEQNNSPELALSTHQQVAGPSHVLYTAGRYEPTGEFTV